MGSQLRALQEDLKNLIFFGKQASHSAFWGHDIPKRLGVYRNNVHMNWTETLESDFPLTQKQFSPEEWEKLELEFFTSHPPQHWELNTSVVPFVQFLKSRKTKPYIKELADYELTDLNTFLHASTPRRGMGVTNPTATTWVYQHQILDWVNKEAPAAKPPRQKPEVLVFYRDTQPAVHVRAADPLMLLMIEHFQKPEAQLEDLEPVRQRLLPTNKVPLDKVLESLVKSELILL
jgi:hypothetical protein